MREGRLAARLPTRFVSVRLADAPQPPAPVPPPPPPQDLPGAETVEIFLPDGCRLRVGAAVTTAMQRRVVVAPRITPTMPTMAAMGSVRLSHDLPELQHPWQPTPPFDLGSYGLRHLISFASSDSRVASWTSWRFSAPSGLRSAIFWVDQQGFLRNPGQNCPNLLANGPSRSPLPITSARLVVRDQPMRR